MTRKRRKEKEEKDDQTISDSKITGKPDWNKIEKAPIDQKLWLPCEQISAYAQLAYDDSRLYVRLHAEEPTIRAENTGMLDQPCQDSCLEFSSAPQSRMRDISTLS